MRIIGGIRRGQRLSSPRNDAIRPTSDRVRESIFNIISGRLEGANVLDLFAGTGAMGLEALSRGAASVLFVDNSREALDLLKGNIALLNLQKRSKVLKWDIGRNLACLANRPERFDLVFLDPPYGRRMVVPALGHLKESGALAHDACLVVEHSTHEDAVPVKAGFALMDQRRYAKTTVTILRNEV